ncbi:MAG: integrin alpha [Coleofasciculaceae cyanobacterium]
MPSSSFNLSELNGSNGFAINSVERVDKLGFSVSSAGDINNDGIDDFIIGDPNGGTSSASGVNKLGASYVVFGSTQIGRGGNINTSSLDGSNGFVINEIQSGNRAFGYSVSNAGDINNDGIDDLIMGELTGWYSSSSNSYVVFGCWGNDTLTGGVGSDSEALLQADRFLLAKNSGTDTITDFESGIDTLALLAGLTFEQLTITQSNNDTLLSVSSTSQVLATLTGVPDNLISVTDFVVL